MTRAYRVHVAAEPADWARWMSGVVAEPGENPHFARARHVEATGETIIQFTNGGFDWICPGCGRVLGGQIAAEPVSGWDAPRWAKSGSAGRPTLTPSLGCPGWRRGDCEGHWWLRDGELILA